MVRNNVMFQAAALLILALFFICCSSVEATDAIPDCCLSVVDKKIPRNAVVSYYHQVKGAGCRVAATVFITRYGKELCAPLPKKNNWVKKLIQRLNKRSGKSSKKTSK
ncbi:C-C motif chemokine 19b [Tachysurus fulvidraco]|uniref:C-C motif chemokine 19b n=1 Tax=Tachysurus fulvidraco TaxID=1234273 RepID=UPI000F4FB8B5|nr:C-C motif chemokine 19b [Tachysurus fulvidraco]